MDARSEDGRRGLERLRMLTVLFDQAFGIPGTRFRFGLDALFGLVPGLGDLVGALVAVYALHVARRLRAPPEIQAHMLSNIALDALVGTVPLVGDIFDFVFKAQTRNLALLEGWVKTPHRTAKRSKWGLILIPAAIILVFATLTILGIWMLFILFHWLFTLGS
ncbi:MAG: DUF4112 domain-containing protein [Pseudomonadota bacterium]